MLLPLGGPGMGMEEVEIEVPSVVKDSYQKYWWGVFTLTVGVAVVDIFAADVFGTIFMGLLAFVVWYMVSSNCKNMTQYCLMLYGMMCLIQSVFDLITLLTMIGGRTVANKTVTNSLSPDGSSTTQTITIQEEKHPFFDPSMGVTYNAQSAVRIASPLVMGLSALLAYWTYSAYPLGLFEAANQEQERGPFAGGGNMGGRGGFSGYGGASGTTGGRVVQGGVVQNGQSTSASRTTHLWEGQGQRLGST